MGFAAGTQHFGQTHQRSDQDAGVPLKPSALAGANGMMSKVAGLDGKPLAAPQMTVQIWKFNTPEDESPPVIEGYGNDPEASAPAA
jgi:hypothetical protein